MKQKFGNTDFKPRIYDIRNMVKDDFSSDIIFNQEILEGFTMSRIRGV